MVMLLITCMIEVNHTASKLGLTSRGSRSRCLEARQLTKPGNVVLLSLPGDNVLEQDGAVSSLGHRRGIDIDLNLRMFAREYVGLEPGRNFENGNPTLQIHRAVNVAHRNWRRTSLK